MTIFRSENSLIETRIKTRKMAVSEKMLGSFQMETSEGFDEFMYEMGVNMFTRLMIMMRMSR